MKIKILFTRPQAFLIFCLNKLNGHKKESFMKRLGYFLIVGLAFTALQVATVEADHEKACEGMTGEARTTCMDEANKSGPPPGEDPCMTLETQALKDACYAEHAGAHPPGAHPPGDGTVPMCGDAPCPPPHGPDCNAEPTEALKNACFEKQSTGHHGDPGHHPPGEHHEHDCSEIPEPEGKALCEKAKERGTPPTAAECAQMPTEEGRNQCMEHAGGMAPGTQECRDGSGTVVPCPTGDDAPNAVQ